MTSSGRIAFACLLALPCYANAAQFTSTQIEQAVARAFGADPVKQSFIKVINTGDRSQIVIQRDAFNTETGIGFLSRFLPETIRLAYVDSWGHQDFKTFDSTPYISRAGIFQDERGTISAQDYLIYGGLISGLNGTALVNVDLGAPVFKSDDGLHKILSANTRFKIGKFEQTFRPSVLDMSMSNYVFEDTRLASSAHAASSLKVGSATYHVNVIGTKLNPLLGRVTSGASFQDLTTLNGGRALRRAFSTASSMTSRYSFDNLKFEGAPLSYTIGSFSMQFESHMCGGCEGRVDIGTDHLDFQDADLKSAFGGLVPPHMSLSGAIAGIDFASLIASRQAMINPFDGSLFQYPTLASQTSFHLPAVKITGYYDHFYLGGTGYLDVTYDGQYHVSGSIPAKLNKGREELRSLLSATTASPKAEKYRQLLRAAFNAGIPDAGDGLDLKIDIDDNIISVNGVVITDALRPAPQSVQ